MITSDLTSPAKKFSFLSARTGDLITRVFHSVCGQNSSLKEKHFLIILHSRLIQCLRSSVQLTSNFISICKHASLIIKVITGKMLTASHVAMLTKQIMVHIHITIRVCENLLLCLFSKVFSLIYILSFSVPKDYVIMSLIDTNANVFIEFTWANGWATSRLGTSGITQQLYIIKLSPSQAALTVKCCIEASILSKIYIIEALKYCRYWNSNL